MIFTAVDPILIRRVREPYGWLGNMSPHPIAFAPELGGEHWRTAEALFQATRFGRDATEVRRQIREAHSPVVAKRIAWQHAASRVVRPHSQEDALRLVLLLKLREHPGLLAALLDTGDRPIIEDCSARPGPGHSATFWGAVRVRDAVDTWQGQNQLGRLWMHIRADKRAAAAR